MQKLKSLLHEELSGWKAFDVIWLVLLCAIITTVTLLTTDTQGFIASHPDTALSVSAIRTCVICSIIAAILGVINVVLGGKGKLSNYFFGLISAVLMIYINFMVKNYGIMAVSVYNFVMQFVGFFKWSKNMNKSTHEVNKCHMTKKERIIYFSILTVATIVLGLIFRQLPNENRPFIDAFITSAQVLSMILMVKMFAEQWWLWIVINIASIYLFLTSREVTFALALMYMVYFVNSIVMCIKWEKEARENDKLLNK
ncbi:MAG: nicotinamide riboside transporter PnuC [Bacteroidales bacterium]|nr:nicotinamide riboside transporter PnuC [Bacteroidales bacterium]